MSAMLMFSWSFQPVGLVDVADGHMSFQVEVNFVVCWGGEKPIEKLM